MGRFAVLIALGLAVLPGMAHAQDQAAPPATAAAPPAAAAADAIETVTVTGMKQPPLVIAHSFINSYAVTSPVAGSIARWRDSLCPQTLGLTPQFSDIVTARLRQIADMVGAKVKAAPCKTNVFIAFTSEPQAMLNAAKLKDPYILGANSARNGTVTHPIQAWYGTATVDLRGVTVPDSNVMGMTGEVPKNFGMLPMGSVGGVPVSSRSGGLVKTGASSVITTVFIVVDLKKVASAPLSAIADYAAMLALSQTDAFESCQPLPSISNLMAPVCTEEKKASAMTPSDIAFLRGIYSSQAGASLMEQQAAIASQMESTVPAD